MKSFVVLLLYLLPLLASATPLKTSPKIVPLDAVFKSITDDGPARLRITTGIEKEYPGVTIHAPQDGWDFSVAEALSVAVQNLGDKEIRVSCRVDPMGATNWTDWVTAYITLAPGQRNVLLVPLLPKFPPQLAAKVFGMRGLPGGLKADRGLNGRIIERILFFVQNPSEQQCFEISELKTVDETHSLVWLGMGEEEFFPMIDQYGQFVHVNWPGKISQASDFVDRRAAEDQDLKAHPGPKDRNKYGGWKDGLQKEATGFFRTEKVGGQWWLVDPEGCLFWSHGIDCVRGNSGTTPVRDREYLFAGLPEEGTPGAAFFGTGGWAPHGYYEGRGRYRTFDFTGANLLAKYGSVWRSVFFERAHVRLKSWGLNTMGNWSDPEVCRMQKTPYVGSVWMKGNPIQGSEGYWGPFPDPFDPELEASLRRGMADQMKQKTVGDPWCLGYFVSNELSWGDETSLSMGALKSPPEQKAKQVFVEVLQNKYGEIASLNSAWHTQHKSWDALLRSTEAPAVENAGDDLRAFYTQIAERYFELCRDVLKEVAPHQLYLGCRFSSVNDRAVHAAAKYCDVVSYNKYKTSLEDLVLPEGVDKPVMIGEFHFGALDRGMFHTGLVPVSDQTARAAAYKNYVISALQNPSVVGAHWFQYGSQAFTGRGDGENYQIGFLDICDTPYAETIDACREISADLYRIRGASGVREVLRQR
jgi:hypothetical protein